MSRKTLWQWLSGFRICTGSIGMKKLRSIIGTWCTPRLPSTGFVAEELSLGAAQDVPRAA
jgi:hypothetical protein